MFGRQEIIWQWREKRETPYPTLTKGKLHVFRDSCAKDTAREGGRWVREKQNSETELGVKWNN